MNNKGFTMVELLVAMAIMGLLVIMAFPTIRAVQTNNTNTKYEEYGKAAISAAKLYTDSYGEDIFDPDISSQFDSISFDKLVTKDLLKDINVSGSSCIAGSSVRVVKYNDSYDYCLDLHCNAGGKEVYTETDKKGSCKDVAARLKTVTYDYKGTKYFSTVIAGDDSYELLDPKRMPGFNFDANQESFKGWSTNNPPTSSPLYKKGTVYPNIINNNITFYAYTEKWKYKINYKKNSDGTYSGNMTQTECTIGKNCPLKDIAFTRTGYHFVKWQRNASTTFTNKENVITRIGNTIKYDGEQVNLTAIFEINKCKVTYSPNSGTFGTHANDLVQTVNYGSYFGDEKDGMRNANGGYYSATKRGHHIDAATAWIDVKNKTYDETKRYLAQTVCDLTKGDNVNTLRANWKVTYYTCSAGNYLKKDAISCSQCLANHYCPGGTYPYNPTKDQGINACPTGYTKSAAGSKAATSCYMSVEKNHYVSTAKISYASACPLGYVRDAHNVYYGNTSACVFKYPYYNSNNQVFLYLQDALNATPSYGTIYLTTNYNDPHSSTLSANKTIVFNAQGHTLNLTNYSINVTGGALNLVNGVINTTTQSKSAINCAGGYVYIYGGMTINCSYYTTTKLGTYAVYISSGYVGLLGGVISSGSAYNSASGYSKAVHMTGGIFDMQGGYLLSNAYRSDGPGGAGINNSGGTAYIRSGSQIIINKGGKGIGGIAANGGHTYMYNGSAISILTSISSSNKAPAVLWAGDGKICYEKGVGINAAGAHHKTQVQEGKPASHITKKGNGKC